MNRWRYIRTTGQLSHSLPYASDRRRKADRYLGTATSALSKNTPQNYIHQLLISGKLNSYLSDINNQAEEMFFRLVNQMAKSEGVNEQLKVSNAMLWVQKMNNIRNKVSEIINAEVIFPE